MKIAGLQKTTLLDYPGKVAATIFTYGCNFCCPFCHNKDLVWGNPERFIAEQEILHFLEKRKGILQGVCITGGEPTLQNDLEGFLVKIKEMGYAIKLDTNGYRPDVLKALVEKGLVDYVAMDVKNHLSAYEKTCGVIVDTNIIKTSIDYLMSGSCRYEFRTTVVKEFHDIESFGELVSLLKGAERYYLQMFRENEQVIEQGLHYVSRDTILAMKEVAQKYVKTVEIRGM